MADEVVLPIPNLSIPQNVFVLSQPNLTHLHDQARKDLLDGIKADQMAPYYKSIISLPHSPILTPDPDLLSSMSSANDAELASLDARLADAQATEGESEISDALKARAFFLARIGEKDKALDALNVAVEKCPGVGSKIDLTLTSVRVGFFFGDMGLVKEGMDKAEKLIDQGGDWDRRNRLKVYTGLYHLTTRQFALASPLLLDALSTFTATELISFDAFVGLTVLSNIVTLERPQLKKKVIDAPEVVGYLASLPSATATQGAQQAYLKGIDASPQQTLSQLLNTLYTSHYSKFFIALAATERMFFLPSRMLSPHTRWYTREMRRLAYTQLLESYRSLTLTSLSEAFGVSEEFVDNDLTSYISTSRLSATIDRVHRIVSTTRPSVRDAQYESLVKAGDVVLNEVQRLSKVLY